jgi:hypothetical protein
MQPNLEAHWTWCDILVKHCVARCGGHLGRKHGWLQGAVGGKNRTTLEAVYPEGLCKALVKDVKKFLDYRNTFQDYYKCEPAVQWAVRPHPTWNTASFQENVAMDNGLEVRTPDRENNLNENNDRRTMSSTASAKKP